jgi:hypothetical protein
MMRHGLMSCASGTRFVSEQGTKMGRRSVLHVHILGQTGVDGIEVGGYVTPVADATMRLGSLCYVRDENDETLLPEFCGEVTMGWSIARSQRLPVNNGDRSRLVFAEIWAGSAFDGTNSPNDLSHRSSASIRASAW